MTNLYRKKPVVIEARQLNAENMHEIAEWCDGNAFPAPAVQRPYVSIFTLEGLMVADLGDWVIKGVKGEFYPCKPDIFEASYEPAGAPA